MARAYVTKRNWPTLKPGSAPPNRRKPSSRLLAMATCGLARVGVVVDVGVEALGRLEGRQKPPRAPRLASSPHPVQILLP